MQSDSMRDGQPGSGDQANQGTQNDQGDQAIRGRVRAVRTGPGRSERPSGQNDQGDQNDQGEDDAGQPATCTSANLTPGTVVREAELAVSSAGSVWRQVDLVLS